MPQMVIESDAFTHRLGQPTLIEIKNDMIEKFKRQNNGRYMIYFIIQILQLLFIIRAS